MIQLLVPIAWALGVIIISAMHTREQIAKYRSGQEVRWNPIIVAISAAFFVYMLTASSIVGYILALGWLAMLSAQAILLTIRLTTTN